MPSIETSNLQEADGTQRCAFSITDPHNCKRFNPRFRRQVEEFSNSEASGSSKHNVNAYFDEHDEDLGLSRTEERQKIFYENNPDLLPDFKNLDEDESARETVNRQFNYFETQRAGY